jgi:hypothetical protein
VYSLVHDALLLAAGKMRVVRQAVLEALSRPKGHRRPAAIDLLCRVIQIRSLTRRQQCWIVHSLASERARKLSLSLSLSLATSLAEGLFIKTKSAAAWADWS